MPGKKKKKFIDKKNAVKFHLVHRSQRDPLQADDSAPQHVLLSAAGSSGQELEARKEEERKFGIFYDDDYDYLQHLKDVNELYEVEPLEERFHPGAPEAPVSRPEDGPRLQLPSSVFASAAETDVGMLNKAVPLRGPQLDWDPDVVAALDDDFNYDAPENKLEDDFITKANASASGEDSLSEGGSDFSEDEDDEEVYKCYRPPVMKKHGDQDEAEQQDHNVASDEEQDFASDEAAEFSDDDDLGSLEGGMFGDVETKSRFTDYSMTSSVIKRTAGLCLLDDRFEKLYEQYDDEEIGALDQEEIPGRITAESELLNTVMEEFEKQQQDLKLKDAVEKGDPVEEESDSEDDADLVKMVIEEPKEKWDCESILSTYSTLYNHPTTIQEPKKVKPIRLTRRAELPKEAIPERGPTRKQLEKESDVSNSGDKANTYRPRKESSEARRARKQAIKEEKRGRREEKKINKLAFKEEQLRQEKELRNLKQNLAGIKIS